MKVIETVLNIGVKKPFEVIHLSDNHLTYADMRDGERKVLLANERKQYFKDPNIVLDYAKKLSKDKNLPIVHTGDLIDFVSYANLEKAKEFVDDTDCFIVAGNHEFSLYVGEAKEDANYRNQSLDLVQKYFKNDIRMSSICIEDVTFVGLDNGYYLFDEEELDYLKKVVDNSEKVVLLLHNPLYDKELFNSIMTYSPAGYLVGVPKELMVNYPLDRYEQQLADDITLKTLDYIKNEPKIKAIITGHIHRNYDGKFNDKIPQLSTDCFDIRIIKFI